MKLDLNKLTPSELKIYIDLVSKANERKDVVQPIVRQPVAQQPAYKQPQYNTSEHGITKDSFFGDKQIQKTILWLLNNHGACFKSRKLQDDELLLRIHVFRLRVLKLIHAHPLHQWKQLLYDVSSALGFKSSERFLHNVKISLVKKNINLSSVLYIGDIDVYCNLKRKSRTFKEFDIDSRIKRLKEQEKAINQEKQPLKNLSEQTIQEINLDTIRVEEVDKFPMDGWNKQALVLAFKDCINKERLLNIFTGNNFGIVDNKEWLFFINEFKKHRSEVCEYFGIEDKFSIKVKDGWKVAIFYDAKNTVLSSYSDLN